MNSLIKRICLILMFVPILNAPYYVFASARGTLDSFGISVTNAEQNTSYSLNLVSNRELRERLKAILSGSQYQLTLSQIIDSEETKLTIDKFYIVFFRAYSNRPSEATVISYTKAFVEFLSETSKHNLAPMTETETSDVYSLIHDLLARKKNSCSKFIKD